MSAKQDRTYARTAQDIERKYSFGKSFAELLGLINESRDKVDSVESSLRSEIIEQSTSLKRDTEEIVLSATKVVKEELNTSISDVETAVSKLTKQTELKVDADGVTIEVEKILQKGVDRVETKTGYVFDEDGLNISKEGEEMTNLLDNTGMYIKKNNKNVLVANNNGVEATDLHAKTYLIIGSGDGKSRFEDYGTDRTGCFWIGG